MSDKQNRPDKTYEQLEERIRELERQLKTHGNRSCKSRLFSFIFGREENKRWTLSLYNALHGTSHSILSDITINTIEDVVYMGMKNDLSFLVSESVSLYRSMELYEQQSSYNPNMPVREFMYAAKLYDQYIYAKKLNRYGRALMPLPIPRLVVFYNGTDPAEDEATLFLSDAFKHEIRQNIINRKDSHKDSRISDTVEEIYKNADPDIEVKVRMININYGHNKKLLSACTPLGEYAWFIARIRRNTAFFKNESGGDGIQAERAIDKAIDEMPDSFEIKQYIIANKAEVKDMCLTEYNEAETMELMQEEARREGRREGWQNAMLFTIKNLMNSMGWTAEQTMDSLMIPASQRNALYAELRNNI